MNGGITAKGARAAVIFTAGFAEVGGDGPALQDEILAIAREHGIRLLGPNCLGLFNAATGHCPTFTSGIEEAMPVPGRVGLVTQSGAYGTHLLNMARDRRIGVRQWVSTGNEADVTALLTPAASSEFLERMSWDQAVMSPGALVRPPAHVPRSTGRLARV